MQQQLRKVADMEEIVDRMETNEFNIGKWCNIESAVS